MAKGKNQKNYQAQLDAFKELGVDAKIIGTLEDEKISIVSFLDNNVRSPKVEHKLVLHTSTGNVVFSSGADLTEELTEAELI